MFLTLPWIVILAGLIYLVASKAGWLEAVGRWSQRRRPPGGGRPAGAGRYNAARRVEGRYPNRIMIRLILRNLTRRRGRTILTVLGIAVGVAAVVALSAMARGMDAGYRAMLGGSKADLVLSQPNSFDIAYSSVDDDLAEALLAMPEIGDVSGMLQGFVQAEGTPFFFVFGYPSGSFVLDRLQIREGVGLDEREAGASRGTPILLGAVAAESLDRVIGDSIRLGDSVYRIIGIFESGDALQDSGAVLSLEDAQTLLGKPRQVSLYYIQLEDMADRPRLETRLARQYPELEVSGTDDFADKQLLDDVLQAYAWGLAGLAIIIGGVGMMNAQLMSVSERTREIGVLRAVGWGRRRVLTMILAESLSLGLLGGLIGVLLGALALAAVGSASQAVAAAIAARGRLSSGYLRSKFFTTNSAA